MTDEQGAASDLTPRSFAAAISGALHEDWHLGHSTDIEDCEECERIEFTVLRWLPRLERAPETNRSSQESG